MRPASVAAGSASQRPSGIFTAVERTFRNPKLGGAALVAYKSAADVGAKAALFAITVLAARRLSSREFGLFALGTTIGWLLAVASDCGMQMHLAREVARAPHAGWTLLRRWGRLRLVTGAIALAALALSLVALAVDARSAVALLVLALVYAATGAVEFLSYFYRGLSRSDIEATVTVAQRAATLVLGVAALLWRPDLVTLATAMLLPALAALAWSTHLARCLARRDQSTLDAPSTSPVRSWRAEFAGDVAPIGVGALLAALYFRIDVLLIEWWAGTEAVARYNAVFRLIDALRLFPAALLAVALPALCRAETLRPLAAAAATATAFAIACTAALWPLSDVIVGALYGPAYRSAAPAFRVLALAFPLMSLNYALTYQLIARRRQRAYALLCAGALAANLALNAWLIPAWSIDGAAWATLATELVLTSGCLAALTLRS